MHHFEKRDIFLLLLLFVIIPVLPEGELLCDRVRGAETVRGGMCGWGCGGLVGAAGRGWESR